MKLRLGLATLTVIGVTAFAPAPFPRPLRRGESAEMTLTAFQGRWRVTNMQTSRKNGQHTPYVWNTTHIRVAQDRWEFVSGNAGGNFLFFSIDPAKKPAHLNFYFRASDKALQGVGLIRRRGSAVQVLYTWGNESQRPTFDPPHEGAWIITLERD